MIKNLLLETIKIEEGKISNLFYHQKRCNESRKALFSTTDILDLKNVIRKIPKKGVWRCRILYAKKVQSVEYIPYVPKEVHSLKIVPSTIKYDFKYAHREKLNALLAIHTEVDEIIIEKDGYLTDTTIANIALYDGKQWVTPKNPLLNGTIREKLLDDGFLKLHNIKRTDLSDYTHLALMNAMIGFTILDDSIKIIKT